MIPEECAGRFRVEGPLGEGSCGVVFRAVQVALGRPVALKVIRGTDLPSLAARFLDEAQVTTRSPTPASSWCWTAAPATGRRGSPTSCSKGRRCSRACRPAPSRSTRRSTSPRRPATPSSTGTLLLRGSDGATVLSHLCALATGASADRRTTMSGSVLTLDLIRMLQPEDLAAARRGATKAGFALSGGVGEITQCKTHYTCGAASMEVWLRLNRPAELVRITHQMFCQGSAAETSSTLKPARFSLIYHSGDRVFSSEMLSGDEGTEDRCDLDILLQSALMDKISMGNWSAYDVYADSGGISNVTGGNSGANPAYLARELKRVTGQPFHYQHVFGSVKSFFLNLKSPVTQAEIVDLAIGQCRAGKQVVVLYNTNPAKATALHYVTLASWDASTETGYVVDTCETKATRSKLYPMTRQYLTERLRAVIHPE